MAIQGTVPVGGSFAPTDSADSFGTHNDKWGIGGHRVVKTTTTRDGIPVNESGLLNLDDDLASGRRKLGMLVYVSDEDKFYILKVDPTTWDGYNEGQKVAALADNANWVEFVGGGGGGDTGNIGFQDNWIKNTADQYIYISPQDGNTWLFLPSDSQAASGNWVELANVDANSGGVYITTNNGIGWNSWKFNPAGTLEVPGRILFGNIDWQSIGVGTTNSHNGANGISLYCAVGYELNWQAGYLAARNYVDPYDIIDIRSDSLIKYATPGDYPTFYSTFDIDTLITKGYLDDQAYLTDAPSDGSTYGRKDGAWEVTTGGIPHATASGTDTYTVTITGVTAYNDGDAYLIRFTNGNTTSSTLNINSLGAKSLYRNNDGPLIGGDIFNGGEMICVYNSGTDGFQCIGSSPNSLFAYVTNGEASTISRGQVVYAFSGTGDRMVVKLASNSGDATSAKTVGVVYSTSIGANQKGIILMQGLMDGLSILPTSTWADGDSVYLGSTAGSITKTKPYAPNHLVYVATVTTASNGNAGRMYVKIQNGYELDEIHDVDLITSPPTTGHYLYYNGTLWTNSSSWQGSTIAVTKGGTGLSALGTSLQLLRVNSGATALEYFTIAKSDVGLGNVENTALSTWAGSTNITTLGTIATGTWNATAIAGTKQTAMVGASAGAAGTQGAVPQPIAGDNGKFLRGDGTWATITGAGVTTVNAFSASSQANGATISGTAITFGPADNNNPGMVSISTQTFTGAKTFSSALTITPTSNQLVLGTTNTTTISATNSGGAKTYTIPNVGTASNFLMSTGTQSFSSIFSLTQADATVASYIKLQGADPTGNATHVNGVTTGTTFPSGMKILLREYTAGYATYIGRSTDLNSMLFACNTSGSFEFWTAFTQNIKFTTNTILVNNGSGTLQQVIGSRKTGWTAATGTATKTSFATDTVSTLELARRVKALIDDLISHGLIGT